MIKETQDDTYTFFLPKEPGLVTPDYLRERAEQALRLKNNGMRLRYNGSPKAIDHFISLIRKIEKEK